MVVASTVGAAAFVDSSLHRPEWCLMTPTANDFVPLSLPYRLVHGSAVSTSWCFPDRSVLLSRRLRIVPCEKSNCSEPRRHSETMGRVVELLVYISIFLL